MPPPPSLASLSLGGGSSGPASLASASLRRTAQAAAMAAQKKDDGFGLADIFDMPLDAAHSVGRLAQEFGAGITGLINVALPDQIGGPFGETRMPGVTLPLGLSGGQDLGGTGGPGLAELGKGAASSIAGTLSTASKLTPFHALLPGDPSAAIESLPARAWGEEYRAKDFFERSKERGFLSAAVEDIGNVALVGATVTAPARAGAAAARAGSRGASAVGATQTAARLAERAAAYTARHGELIRNPVIRAVQHPYQTAASGLRSGVLKPALARTNLADGIAEATPEMAPPDPATRITELTPEPSLVGAPPPARPAVEDFEADLDAEMRADAETAPAPPVVAAAPIAGAGTRFLARIEQKLQGRDVARVMAEKSREADMARSKAARSEAVNGAVSAARDLLMTKAQELGVPGVTRTTASQMIGDEVNLRLNGVHHLIEGEFPGATPEMLQRLGIRQSVVPEALRTPELAAALDEVSAAFEGERLLATAELRASRGGDRGLDADPIEPVLTKAQERVLTEARRKLERAFDKSTERAVERGREARVRQIGQLNDKLGRLAAQSARLDELEAGALSRFEHSRSWTPRAWRSPEALAATAQKLYDATVANGGASFDPHASAAGRFLTPGKDPGYAVAVVPGTALSVPLAELTPQHFMDVARAYQDVFRHPNTVLGSWVDDDGMVHIDPSEIVGADPAMPRSEAVAQAAVVGALRGQESIFDIAGDSVIDTPLRDRPDVAARFLDRDGRVTPHLRRAYGQILDSVTGAGMPAEDAHALVTLEMTLAVSAADKGKLASPDEWFQVLRHERAKKPSRLSRALRQEIPNRRVGTRAQRKQLWREVEKLVTDLDHALAWYTNSHAEIERRFRGMEDVTLLDGVTRINPADLTYQLLAASSINASPRDNLGFAFQALAATQTLDGAVYTRAINALDRHAAGKLTLEQLVDEIVPSMDRSKAKNRRKVADAFLMESVPKEVHGLPLARQMVLEILQGNLLAKQDVDGNWVPQWGPEYLNATNETFGTASRVADAGVVKEKVKGVDVGEAFGRLGEEQVVREVNSQSGRAKIISFWENLARPSDSLSVTLDRVMMETLGSQVPGSATWSDPRWLTTADKLREMAEELSPALGRKLQPHEVQAALWVFGKEEISRVQRGHFLAYAGDVEAQIRRGVELTDDTDPMLSWVAESLAPYHGEGDTAPRLPDDRKPLVRRERRIKDKDTGVETTENITIDPGTTPLPKVESLWATREARWLGARDSINAMLRKGDIDGALAAHAAYVKQTLNQAPRSGGLLDDVGGGDFFDLLAKDNQPNGMLAAVQALADAGMDIGPIGRTRLEQAFGDSVLGEFVPHSEVTGGVIRVFEGANFQTLVHENGHVLRTMLTDAEMSAMEAAYGVKGGRWDVAAEERFANDFLLHMMTGKAPEGLKSVFTRVKDTVREVWEAIRDTFQGRRIPIESRQVFDSWLRPERVAAPDGTLATTPETGSLAQRLQRTPELPQPPAGKRDFYEAGRRGQKALDDLALVARRRKQLDETRANVRHQITQIEDTLLGRRTPAELARQALIDEAARLKGKVAKAQERPSIRRAPAAWQPLLAAIYKIEAEIEQNPGLAQVFDGLPETLAGIQARAAEMGFEPTHVADMTRDKVNRLVYENMRLGLNPVTEMVAGQRKNRAGVLTRAGAVDRSIESLLAATVEATVEAKTNAVIDWIENTASRKIAKGAVVPEGWQLWEPTRSFLLTGTELSKDGQKLLTTSAQESMIVPKAVIDTVHRYTKNHDHRALRAIGKVTNPWRTLVLTLSPGWYVRNFAGNVMLASIDGVRLQDWVAAWKSFRTKDAVGRFADIPFVESGSLARDAGVMADHSLIPSAGPRELMSEQGAIRGGTQAVLRRLTRANEVVDEFARSAVYHKNVNRMNMPEAKAWDLANKAMVDYQALSPFERSVVRAVVPFYSWQKGILKVTMNQMIDHPARANILMQLGRMQEEYVADRLGLEVGDVPDQYRHLVGDRNVRSYNPFADSASLLTPEGIAQSLNPIIEIALRDGLGAPEFVGRDTPMRLSPFGTAQYDVDAGEEMLGLITRSPFGRILGADGPGDTIGTALGLKPVDDDVLRDRFLRARSRIEGSASPQRVFTPTG